MMEMMGGGGGGLAEMMKMMAGAGFAPRDDETTSQHQPESK
jgi:hypothetical protein